MCVKWKERKAFSASELPCPGQKWSEPCPTQLLADASTICCYTSLCELRACQSVHILLILENDAFKTLLLALVKFPIITPRNMHYAAVPFHSLLETSTKRKKKKNHKA